MTKMTKMTKAQKADQAASADIMRQYLRHADGTDPTEARPAPVRMLVTHVSRSGMQRRIKFLLAHNGEVWDMSHDVGTAIGWPVDDRGVKVDGCGMDMCFHLAYTLGMVLYHDTQSTRAGYAITNR